MTNSDIVHALKRINIVLLEIKSISHSNLIDDLCVTGISEVSELSDKLVDGLVAEADPMM